MLPPQQPLRLPPPSQVAKRFALVYYIITCFKRFNVKPSHFAKWQEDKIGAKLLTRVSILAAPLFLLSFR